MIGFSGADIELVCREAAMMPVRRLMARLMALDCSATTTAAAALSSSAGSSGGEGVAVVAPSRRGPYAGGGVRGVAAAPDVDALIKTDTVKEADLRLALQTTRPSSDGKEDRYKHDLTSTWCILFVAITICYYCSFLFLVFKVFNVSLFICFYLASRYRAWQQEFGSV